MSKTIETFSSEQVKLAIKQFLDYGEQEFLKSHQGYFSGGGWAARCLRSIAAEEAQGVSAAHFTKISTSGSKSELLARLGGSGGLSTNNTLEDIKSEIRLINNWSLQSTPPADHIGDATTLVAQRPINCGTGHCSCVECVMPTPTGWDNGLSQDYCKGLGQWLANRPGARQQLREMLAADHVEDVRAMVPMTNLDRMNCANARGLIQSMGMWEAFEFGISDAESHHGIK